MKLKLITGATGVDYSDAPQRSPEWLALHTARVGASDLGRWMSVSKRDGKPLKARSDLEREIAFEKAFGVPFNKYVTGAMQAGIDNEPFVRDQVSSQLGIVIRVAGAFYDDYSIASPDGLIDDDGGLEIKWLQDSNWTEVLLSGKPLPDHELQCQGNLRLSGRKYWLYVAANGNTGRFIVIRVERDEAVIAQIDEAVKEVAKVEPLVADGLFTFSGETPEQINENIWEN